MKSQIHNINLGFMLAAIGSLLYGFTQLHRPIVTVDALTILFAVFFCFLRLKIYLDDWKYFDKEETTSAHFRIGFILAFIAMALWIYSGYEITDLAEAFYSLGLAMILLTIQIIVVALRAGASKNHYYWLITNLVYISFLFTLQRYILNKSSDMSLLILIVVNVVLVVDFALSKSFSVLKGKPR